MHISDFEKLLCRSGVCHSRNRAKRVAKAIDGAYAAYGAAMFDSLADALVTAQLAQTPEAAAVISVLSQRWLEGR